MLGKLFNLTASTAGNAVSQPPDTPSAPSPESVQEEIHTRSLLFPDTQSLFSRQDQVFPLPAVPALLPTSPNTFDYDGELDLEFRDVRVIVMQDSLGSVNPALLYDSHPGPVVPSPNERSSATHPPGSAQDLRRNPTTPRKTSLGQNSRPMVMPPESPQPRQGAFDRRSSVHSRHYHYVETETQRSAREYREELASFTSCIFANSEVMSYKGTSTKVHVIPSESKPDVSSSYLGDGKGSMGRSSMRSSRLAQSYTSESTGAPFVSSSTTQRLVERRKILVTRLFPVNLPSDDMETPNSGATPHSRLSEDAAGFPFPYSPDEANTKKKKPQPKQKRTPMYAVALVLQLPASPVQPSAKSTFRGASSYNEQDSFPSSYNSARRSGWSMVGSGFGTESFDSACSVDGEDRMDVVTQHWDIIMRSLTHLQSVVATSLFPMLKTADFTLPDPQPPAVMAQLARTTSVNGRRGSAASQMKPPKSNAKLVALPPNCLMQDSQIGREMEAVRVRIVSGLRATRVVTGQGRWGPWREEARWVAKWTGGKEHGFFFFTLLTGFLATHTDWLQALSPVWYRKRYNHQQSTRGEEDTSLPSRTIIVSKDKMAARRLIFLLSAFLPANQQLPTVKTHRPTTSASFSHSPPSYIVPILKEESLRRKINRRPGAVSSMGPSHGRSFSIQSQATTRSTTGVPAQLAHLSMDSHHERRTSDATLFRQSALPMPGNDLNTRKSSAATANTITPDAAVPHFSSMHRADTQQSTRPGSSGSTVADDLKRTLRRGDSSGHASHASTHTRSRSSHWGSVLTGLWSARRRDSTATTSSALDSPGRSRFPPLSPAVETGNKLTEMVKEAQVLDNVSRHQLESSGSSPKTSSEQPETPRIFEHRGQPSLTKPVKRVPDPEGAFESPVKTSINSDDGVIDVDIQFPEYLTSFESAVSSPSSSGYLSTPGLGSGLDSFEQLSRLIVDGDAPLNVAGWLQQFHRDFALQAIAPQNDLVDKVKESLRAEATPSTNAQMTSGDWSSERWVDVSSAIIADTTDFTIRRIKYRRLVKPKPAAEKTSGQHLASSSYPFNSTAMTPALSPYEQPLNEKFEEELLVTLDETLIEAIEKVIAHPSDASKDNSNNSSRSVSKKREQQSIPAAEPEETDAALVRQGVPEVPRSQCKTVVLSALEGIVRDVVDQREKEGDSSSPHAKYATERCKEKDSVLRTAVRGWLDTVELGDG